MVRRGHLRALIVARAIENQSYLVLANRVGADNGDTFCGDSAVIDPGGAILAAASSDGEELVEAEISSSAIAAVRERMPVFAHRRPELYSAKRSLSQTGGQLRETTHAAVAERCPPPEKAMRNPGKRRELCNL